MSENSATVNEKLKVLYKAWYEHIKPHADIYQGHSRPYLLCCDETLPTVMMFGKEANEKNDTKFVDVVTKGDISLDNGYSKNILRRLNGDSANNTGVRYTGYIKTRLLLAGIDLYGSTNNNRDYTAEDVSKVVVNNLNKISFSGKAPRYKMKPEDEDFLYSAFEYNNMSANIFVHELNILKPQYVVLACGTGYDEHIRRIFDDDVDIKQIKVDDLSNPNFNDDLFKGSHINLNDGSEIKIIHVPHPSERNTHLNKDNRRCNYNKILTKFIKT